MYKSWYLHKWFFPGLFIWHKSEKSSYPEVVLITIWFVPIYRYKSNNN